MAGIKRFLTTNLKVLNVIAIHSFLLFFFSCAAQKPVAQKMDEDKQQQVVKRADALLEQGKYVEARRLLNAFWEKYPVSPYADDAAYRLAYMKTINDSRNPFFDYAEALRDFRNFNGQFPHSAYLSACNNWQKILNLYFDLNTQAKRLKKQLAQQQKTIDRLNSENEELRRTLSDLEKALER
ncbi:MAG TPA: tetratricopeptide repeat protein [Calditrichaeota bacterium]|nr:tetratricopeptide repeat protein [Calditrichota bacterium]